jgi:hypothetical protein
MFTPLEYSYHVYYLMFEVEECGSVKFIKL